MKNQWILVLVVIGIIVAAMTMGCCGKSSPSQGSERFGNVLGQLGPYQVELNECLKRCTRTDPSDRLLPMGNMYCSMYCDTIMTEKAKRGIPPRDFIVTNNLDKCQRQCNKPDTSPQEKRTCISTCYGHNEVVDWCKSLWCPYSLDNQDRCMKHCTSTWNTNNNQVAWKWGYTN